MDIQTIARHIVEDAQLLKDAKTNARGAMVNYACIFAQDENEYDDLDGIAQRWGKRVHETKMGDVYQIPPLQTSAGALRLLKIRKPDPSRKEMGDADFTLEDYESFKRDWLGLPGFSLIERPNMEMIELIDPQYDVRAYFSHPTLAEVLGLEF